MALSRFVFNFGRRTSSLIAPTNIAPAIATSTSLSSINKINLSSVYRLSGLSSEKLEKKDLDDERTAEDDKKMSHLTSIIDKLEKATKSKNVEGEEKESLQPFEAYDELGIEFETLAESWGWKSPTVVSDLCIKHIKNLGNKSCIYNNNGNINVFDAGCGTGLVAETLSNKWNEASFNGTLKYKGCDLSSEMVKASNNKNIYLDCRVHDMDDVPFPWKDNEFDIIICSGVLPYCQNIKGILNDWLRMVKPNGIIITSLRTDMIDAIEYFDELDNNKKWETLELTKPINHLPNNPTYTDNGLQAQYYVARKL